MAETTTLARSNPFGNNYKIVAGNNPKAQITTKNSSNPSGTVQPKKAWRITDDNDINKLRTMVNQRNINDRANYAYDVALNLARRDQEQDRRTRGFANFNTEADLTSKADKYYDQLMQGAEHPTGAQMRGENAFTQALGGIREGINGFNNMIGTGIDWGVDRFGDLVGAVTGRDDWKQSIQDATTGEDLAIIPDILEDIGLVALTGPVGGAALLGAKGLLQNTDNFQEALTGIDHITGARLTGGQRLANTAAGLGGTALTMLPGFSAAKAGEKLIGKELGAGIESAEKGLSKAEESAAKLKKYNKKIDKAEDEAIKVYREATLKQTPTMADIIKDPTITSKFAQARENTIKLARKEAQKAFKEKQGIESIQELRKAGSKKSQKAYEKALEEAKASQEAFAKFAPKTGEEDAMTLRELAQLALRNPFSKEAREYNKLAKQAYKQNFAQAYNLDRNGLVDPESGELIKIAGEDGIERAVMPGSTRKAIWNLINGKTFGAASGSREAELAAEELAKRKAKAAGKEIAEEGTKDAAKAAEKQAEKKGFSAILDRLSARGVRDATNGQTGKRMLGLEGPGAIKGFGLTAGSGLAEVMANEPGGFQAAINNYADTMGKTPDNQLLPLALAMLPGYRKGFARMFGGNTLPYYGVKAQLAQRGVNNVYNNRYTDEDNENLLKAIGGK